MATWWTDLMNALKEESRYNPYWTPKITSHHFHCNLTVKSEKINSKLERGVDIVSAGLCRWNACRVYGLHDHRDTDVGDHIYYYAGCFPGRFLPVSIQDSLPGRQDWRWDGETLLALGCPFLWARWAYLHCCATAHSESSPNWSFFLDQTPWSWMSYATLFFLGYLARWLYNRRRALAPDAISTWESVKLHLALGFKLACSPPGAHWTH